MKFLRKSSLFLSAVILALTTAGNGSAENKIEFNRDIRPILSNHCFNCHGPDAATREAGLRLDQRAAATTPADSGETAITPGHVDKSELINRITSPDDDLRMPPAEGNSKLTPKQIDLLRRWISAGAEYQAHWAFVKPQQPKIPAATNSQDWCRNDIDRFVLARLQSKERAPQPSATPETLIRRVAFDLTGLPPTPAEIDRFLQDKSEDAYEQMVERYLAKPAYGEHMARHWMDLARYADTNGYQYDTERSQWVWRDWVINAYNNNMSFRQFTIEQLAGDLLPNATPQQILATGFNRNHGITIEGGIIDEEYRTEYVMDRLVTTGTVWLGLTIGCARCHEHKYDPISQKEFYQLYAFFNQVPERGMRGFAPQMNIPSPLAENQNTALDQEISELQKKLAEKLDIERDLQRWIGQIAQSDAPQWQVLMPAEMRSSGGSTLVIQTDNSVLAGGANPSKDIYEISATTQQQGLTAVRLEALLDKSLPGGGPGRHSNSNFVLSEFELTVVSTKDPSQKQSVRFQRAIADYSQNNYEIAKAIDGTVAGNSGWAVDGPTRKKPATAIFIASKPFGFAGGSKLKFRLRHEASFSTHGIGRARLSVGNAPAEAYEISDMPAAVVEAARKPVAARSSAESKQLRDYFLANHHPHQALRNKLQSLQKRRAAAFPSTMVMQDMSKMRETFILDRGAYDAPTERVTAQVPAIFTPLPSDAAANRLTFADWLMSPDHPLTARVAVNRHWQRLFGTGLVKTSEDFGIQGELPSHPELLDWLSTQFVASDWNVKQLLRLILNSATYRQSSHVAATAYREDPENRLLARGPRMRLDAEEIRDAALAAGGLLVNRVGGKSVYPYQPKGLWLELNNRPGYSKAYPQGNGDELYRRSLYTFWKRTVPSPMMKTLDAPEREFCTVRRSRTNTPLQALLLLNGPQFVEAARGLAKQMLTKPNASLTDQLELGFRTVTARRPNADELAVLTEFFETTRKEYLADESAAKKLLQVGQTTNEELPWADWAAMTRVARLLLNLNEAITKG